MDNFKEIAKKVLARELSGIFVLRNGTRVSSDHLISSDGTTSNLEFYPYKLRIEGAAYSYTSKGNFLLDGRVDDYDIIDFIEDKTIDNKRNVSITLEKAKEWYKAGGQLKEVALQAFTEEELKDDKPKSWNEYCMLMKCNDDSGYVISGDSRIMIDSWRIMNNPTEWKSTLPSKELAEAFLAMMQLISLRKAWVGDWEPEWDDMWNPKYCIEYYKENPYIVKYYRNSRSLSFPIGELAEEFLECFKDLIEVAKPLI